MGRDGGGGGPSRYLVRDSDVAGKKTVLWSRLYIKTIILPRQARDKRRDSTQNRDRFLAGVRRGAEGRADLGAGGERHVHPHCGAANAFRSCTVLI